MSVIPLRTAPPLGAVYSQQPEMALKTTRLTQIVKPINGTQYLDVTSSNASSVEFKLTSQNMLDPFGCYFNFSIIAPAPATTTTSGVTTNDWEIEFLGANAVIQSATIRGPDGNTLEYIDNYNLLAHMMIKANISEDYLRSCASVMWGVDSSLSEAKGTYGN